ncbi:major ampullate spidroin 1 [Nitrospirillum viridazoti Y2]|nr:major ampullate spidroin 1 [Nitrospirillum amazonense Y2]
MAAHVQAARALGIGAVDANVRGQRDGRPDVADRVRAAHIDRIAQADVARSEDHVGTGVADGPAGERAHHGAAAAGDAQIPRRDVGDVAADGAAVGQGAQGTGRGDVQRRGAAGRIGQGTRDVQHGQAGADVVVARHGQQVAAAGGPQRVQAREAADHRGPGVGRAVAAPDQGDAVPHQVVGRPAHPGIDHPARHLGGTADAQAMAGHRQRACRLAVVAGHRHVAGQGQAGTAVADRVAGHVDGVAQADGTRREGQVAQAVADGATREAAHRAIGTTDDHQVVGAGVDHVADDRTAVGQGPQAAGAGDQHRRGGVDRAGVAQGAQRATDIVAEQRQQQVGGRAVGARAQGGAEACGSGTEAAGGQGSAHLGDGVALARDQVAARQRRHRHRAAGEGGVAADQQLTRRATADAHGQRAGALRVVTRHADGVGQQHVGAAVHQRATADVHLIVQHQVAAGQFHIRQRAGDGADAVGPGQRAHGATRAAGDAEAGGAGVGDVAGYRTAVGQGAQRARAGDVDRRGAAGGVGQAAGDGQTVQSAADIVVRGHGQQVGAAGRAGRRQAGDTAGHHGAGIVGTGTALDQGGAVTHQVIAGAIETGGDRAAADSGGPADVQAMAGHVECARRLTVGTGDGDVAGQGDVRPVVADGMAGDIDGVAQADSTRREAEVAQAVVDGAAGEQPRRRAAATHDHQIMAAGVEQVADQGATVGQRAQAAAGRDVHSCGGGEGAGVGKIAQGTPDIVVADHRQQVGARHALAHHQTSEAALDHHADVAGADAAGHQCRGTAGQEVSCGRVVRQHGAAAQAGGTADG